jgi:hypothetical protein
MSDTYDAGYLPDAADCDQDSIRVELAYSHEFYTAIIEGQEERIAELEKEVSIARRCVFNLDCNIKELESENKELQEYLKELE